LRLSWYKAFSAKILKTDSCLVLQYSLLASLISSWAIIFDAKNRVEAPLKMQKLFQIENHLASLNLNI
jgi:hypothetical protein